MDMEKSSMYVFGQKSIDFLELLGFRRQKSDVIFVQNLTFTTIVKAN